MVDAPADVLSLTALAAKRGVSKQAIHKRVTALVSEGLLQTFPGPNRSVLVSESAFVMAVAQTGDPSKEASAIGAAMMRGAPERPVDGEAGTSDGRQVKAGESSLFRDAKAQDAHFSSLLKKLAFERADGQLYSVLEVDAAMIRLADAVKDEAKSLVSFAEDGAVAYEAGMPAFRRWLGQLGDDLCRRLASKFRMLAEDARDDQIIPPDEEDGGGDEE